MARLPLKLLTAALLLQLFLAAGGTIATSAIESFQGVPDAANATPLRLQERSDSVVTRRQLLQASPSALPNITIPPFLQNITAAQAFNLSSINQTLILSQLRVSANLTELFEENVTRAYVESLVNKTLPLLLACSSNATGDLFVCFRTWQWVFNKSSLNVTEEQFRFAVFVNNTQAIIAQNAALVRFFTLPNGAVNQTLIAQLFLEVELPPEIESLLNSTWLLSFNAYLDGTLAELRGRYGGGRSGDPPGLPEGQNITLVDEAIGERKLLQQFSSQGSKGTANWLGYANAVRDQGYCGFCWVFAVTGSLEMVNNVAVGSRSYLCSDESIVDCLGMKCSPGGGFVHWASWVPKNRFWLSLARAPYQEEDGSKLQCSAGAPENWFKNLVRCTYTWENWKRVLDVQPTLFHINAEKLSGETKGATVYKTQCSKSVTATNHVLVAVGYSTYTDRNGDVIEYVIYRNSWGTDFGFEGYGFWAMTKNGVDLNLCASTSEGIIFHTKSSIILPKIPGCKILTLSDKVS